MKEHGLTMIEMLVAMVLLSALCTVLASWTSSIARVSREQTPRMLWHDAAIGVLELIEDDLECSDFPVVDNRGRPIDRVALVDGKELRIQTRSTSTQHPDAPGSAIHEYVFDGPSNSLRLTMTSLCDASVKSTRTLLSDVHDWQVHIEEESKLLMVQIVDSAGLSLTRRYLWSQ